jgi:hypothetical protein
LLGYHTVWQSYGMDTPSVTTQYKNHRFLADIISHAVWLYFRFCLSFRDVEELETIPNRGQIWPEMRQERARARQNRGLPNSSEGISARKSSRGYGIRRRW